MAREEDRNRSNEYVPSGPVRIRPTGFIERQDASDARLVARIEVLEAQVRSLQMGTVSGILLSGWSCPKCKVFVGEEKELQATCRCCGGPKP